MNLLFLLFSIFCVGGISAENPSVRVRITKKGFDYLNRLGRLFIQTSLQNKALPDFSREFRSRTVEFSTKHTKIHAFEIGGSDYRLVKPNLVKWTLSGINAEISTTYRINKKNLLRYDGGGPVKINVSDGSATATVGLWGYANATPAVKVENVTVQVETLTVVYTKSTITNWVLNKFKKTINEYLKNMLMSAAPAPVGASMEKFASHKLSTFQYLLPLRDGFLLDYTMVQDMTVTEDFAEFGFRAEVKFGDRMERLIEDGPPALPESDLADQMIYVWIGDHLMNSALQGAHNKGLLTVVVSKDTIPAAHAKGLRTTCGYRQCIGSALTTVAEKFPNESVEILVESQEPPVYKTISGMDGPKVTGNFSGFVFLRNGSNGTTPLVSMDILMTARSEVKVTCAKYSANIYNTYIKFERPVSHIGPMEDGEFTYLKIGMQGVVDKLVNRFAIEDADIPGLSVLKFENPKIEMVRDAVLVYSDLYYTPV